MPGAGSYLDVQPAWPAIHLVLAGAA